VAFSFVIQLMETELEEILLTDTEEITGAVLSICFELSVVGYRSRLLNALSFA